MASYNGGSIDTNQEQILALTTKINTNNTDLNSILATINNLPSASSGTTEDLSTELTEQNTLITTQETTIDNIISALEGKAAGGSGGLQEENVSVTLSITSSASSHRPDISYLTYENGEFVPKFIDVSTNDYSSTLSVAKGSFITLQKPDDSSRMTFSSPVGDIEIFMTNSFVIQTIMAQINGSGTLRVISNTSNSGGSAE